MLFVASNHSLDNKNNNEILIKGDGIPLIIPPAHRRYERVLTPGESSSFDHKKTVTPSPESPEPSPVATMPGRIRSPFMLMISNGRLTDFFEFLSTGYGIEGDEALTVLGRFHHA